MIGDKWYAEAADFRRIRPPGVVGERCKCGEAEPEGTVERLQVRMQT